MLAIGRALMSQPRLLLIDEMSLGLSPLLVQEISRVIKDINKSRKLTIFLVEQDVNIALSMADRGYIIENGRIQDQGDARALLHSERVKEAYLGIGPAEKARLNSGKCNPDYCLWDCGGSTLWADSVRPWSDHGYYEISQYCPWQFHNTWRLC